MSDEVTIKSRAGFVYLIKSESGHYKIGHSKNPDGRAGVLDVGPFALEIVHQIATDNARWLEKKFHRKYHAKRVRGEWFLLTDDDVAEIKSISRYDQPPLLVPRRATGWKCKRRKYSDPDDSRPQGALPFRVPLPLVKLLPQDVPGKTFGERLTQFRKAAGLSQPQLAERSGVPLGTIREYEQNRREPLLSKACKLAAALGMDCDAFCPKEEPAKRKGNK